MLSVGARLRQSKRIMVLKQARLYGKTINETQIQNWFELALNIPVPDKHDFPQRMRGFITLLEKFKGGEGQFHNADGVAMVRAAMMQLADRRRVFKRKGIISD